MHRVATALGWAVLGAAVLLMLVLLVGAPEGESAGVEAVAAVVSAVAAVVAIVFSQRGAADSRDVREVRDQVQVLATRIETATALANPPVVWWSMTGELVDGRLILRHEMIPDPSDLPRGMTLLELRCLGSEAWLKMPFKTVTPCRLQMPGEQIEHPILLDVPVSSLPDEPSFTLWRLLRDDRYPELIWVMGDAVYPRQIAEGQTGQSTGAFVLPEQLDPRQRTFLEQAKQIAN